MLLIRTLLLEQLDGELQLEQELPLTHHDVLLKLSEAPGGQQRMSELADRVLLTKSGLTRVIDVLEKNGLVERVRSEEDARGRYARLTPAGRARLQAAHPVHVRGVRALFLDKLSDDQVHCLVKTWHAVLADRGQAASPVRGRPPPGTECDPGVAGDSRPDARATMNAGLGREHGLRLASRQNRASVLARSLLAAGPMQECQPSPLQCRILTKPELSGVTGSRLSGGCYVPDAASRGGGALPRPARTRASRGAVSGTRPRASQAPGAAAVRARRATGFTSGRRAGGHRARGWLPSAARQVRLGCRAARRHCSAVGVPVRRRSRRPDRG